MNPSRFHDADALRNAGVHLTPYGLPAYTTAGNTNRLRQILKGIPMPGDILVEHDHEMVDTLAAGWVDVDAMIPQFKSPRYKSTRAGMSATVSGLMFMTALQTNPFNPRPNTKLEIPAVDASGRVAMPWAPTDRTADPTNDARMLVQVLDRDELNNRVVESERHIVAEQASLADMISREGVEEDLLALVVRYETAGLVSPLAATTVDGNSRLAIARAEYRHWVSRYREEILDVVRSSRPRVALARTVDRMRDGLFPLEHDDPVALRHLHKAIVEVVEKRSTTKLIDEDLYGIANTFVVPVTMIVAFSPASVDSTVLDAADLMMRNLHHPARAAKIWDQASGHSEIRDEVAAKLYDNGSLTIGQSLYLGPRYEEAVCVHGLPPEPDRRAFAAVDLINGNHNLGREARALIRDAIGSGAGLGRAPRAQIITSMLTEQVRTLSAKSRKSFETTMHDVLDTKRYGSVLHTPADSDDDADELLAAAKEYVAKGYTPDNSEAIMELALKGAIALAALGHLTRVYGTKTEEMPRPYQILDNMLADKSGLGMQILSDGVAAWRNGTPLPEYDTDKRKPIKGAAPMRPTTLAVMFPNPGQTVEATDSATDLLVKMQKILAAVFQPILDELLKLPEVRREGAPPDAVQEVLDILVPAREKLGLQAAKFEEFHADEEDEVEDEYDAPEEEG
jgi:hypothetical protein